jgi:hypothetical protein
MKKWKPISLPELQALITSDVDACTDEQRAWFARVAFAPEKWSQSPWGDLGGGFWAVAVDEDRVLWYNDIEDGFNVSYFTRRGEIPGDEYWCDKSSLGPALRALPDGPGGRWGPPEPLTPYGI